MKIDADLARRLVAAQFPQWAHLPIRPVAHGGWDNRTFHLGDAMTVRLPSADGYVPAVEKEQRWLPVLAPHLPLPDSRAARTGRPGAGYPCPWSVYRWLDGETATPRHASPTSRTFADDLAGFLIALQGIDATGGPPPGGTASSGARPDRYDDETRTAIKALGGRIDGALCERRSGTRRSAPTWHGRAGLVPRRHRRRQPARPCRPARGGDRLRHLGRGRPGLRRADRVDAVLGREPRGLPGGAGGRRRDLGARPGWTLWKALITLDAENPATAAGARASFDEVLAEYRS